MMNGWYILIAAVVAWLVAQVSKTVIGLLGDHKNSRVVNWRTAIGYFTRSGGMPSGHTASLAAVCTYLGCSLGFGSEMFALAFWMWLIVVYDAIHVRYAVGVQGKALNGLLKQAGKPELPIVEGHTLPQVIVGAVIGIGVGLLTFWLTTSFIA